MITTNTEVRSLSVTLKFLRGFTLFEILIALFIFTIVSIILTSTLHSIFDFEAHMEKNSKRFSELQLAMLLFSRDVEQIINRPSINVKGITEETLIGNVNSITFTHAGLLNPDGSEPRTTLQRTHYYLNKNHMVRETWDVLDQTSKSQTHSRNLIEGYDLRFQYLDENGVFQTKWPPPSSRKALPLPKAIRISLTLDHWGKISQLFLIPS